LKWKDPICGLPLIGLTQVFDIRKLRAGVRKILANGYLRGKPAIIVTGRSDDVLSINHASRSYFGLNQTVEGLYSNLRYYEVTNAHHLDTSNTLDGFDERMIPLHYYFTKAMERKKSTLILP
jgi:hydroxybutyrate-dimer hydrolase